MDRSKQKPLSKLPSWLKKYLFEYLDTRTIFLIDLILSILSSVLVLFAVSLFSDSQRFYMGNFGRWWMLASIASTLISLFVFKTHKVIIRYSQMRDLLGIFRISALKVILMLAVLVLTTIINRTILLSLVVDFLLTSVLLIGVRIAMILVYDIYKSRIKARQNCMNVLVYGTSEKAVSMVSRLKDSPHYQIIGFIVPHTFPSKVRVADTPVFGYNDDKKLASIFNRYSLDGVLFASEADAKVEKDALIQFCTNNGIKVLIAPSIDEVVGGRMMKSKVRNIKVEDLLGREEIRLNVEGIRHECEGKTILVTGCCCSTTPRPRCTTSASNSRRGSRP